MGLLWGKVERKLNKSKRQWKEVPRSLASYREAELFCEQCRVSLGVHDIVYTDLETIKYCSQCIKRYIKETPINIDCGKVIEDFGSHVLLEYTNDFDLLKVTKVCYFNTKGRYIKIKGKRYYI